MFTVKNLGIKVEGRWLWRQLNLSLPLGHFIAVTGPSGSGKTSLLRCLAGEISPHEGRITTSHSSIAMIHQDLQLAHGATCLMNALGGALGRHSFLSTLFSFPASEREQAEELLHSFGLAGKERQWASTLSRGERQRLAICRTLLARPHILLADEPVASLDFDWADNTLSMLRQNMAGQHGLLICSLHDESQVSRFADYRLHLDTSLENGWSFQPVTPSPSR